MSEKSTFITKTRYLTVPITCLEFIEGFILAGEGPFIRVYCSSTTDDSQWINIANYAVFKSVSVHAMKICTVKTDSRFHMCALGGKCMRIMQLSPQPEFFIEFTSQIFTFQDWIWDGRWFSTTQIALIMAQNYVILWDSVDSNSVKKFQCETKCILYCGIVIGSEWCTGVVMSGTVFKEVLIWSPVLSQDKGDCCPVLHQLLGHEGVIFSIHYDEELRKLCTSSDDRSVHLWSHNLSPESTNTNGRLTVSDWKSSTFTLLGKLFGHESRVCKAKILPAHCVSAGEDSMLCLWKYDVVASDSFQLEKKISCHAGSAIRSICTDNQMNAIITGGDDSGIKLWPMLAQSLNDLDNINTVIFNAELGVDKGCPRELKLLDDKYMVILTDIGHLLCYNLMTKEVRVWLSDIKVKSENVLDIFLIEEGISLIAFGDVHGKVTILKTCRSHFNETNLEFEEIAQFVCCSGKVFTVKWVDPCQLLTCGVNGQMNLWRIEELNSTFVAKLVAKFELPPCKHRWVSSAKLFHNFKNRLICGSRGGSVYVYDLPIVKEITDVIYPSQCFSRIHGSHGVSNIHVFDETNVIYTTGRDGILATFEIESNGLKQMNRIRIAGCPKWISGVMKRGTDLLVYGFHDERFILWSEQHQTVLTEIHCGGGHRSWDLYFNTTSFTFVYIKEGDIGRVTKDLKYALPVSIKPGHHSRQINVVKHLFVEGSKSYFATASEDNTIRIWSINMLKSVNNVLMEHCLKGHISSVKTISLCPLSCSGIKSKNYLLVTAGGRAQILCWKLSLYIDVDKSQIKVQHLMTYMLNSETYKSRKPWKDQSFTMDPETRFMDLAVWKVDNGNGPSSNDAIVILAVACSDALVRYYSYNLATNQMNLWLHHSAHGECCILKLHYCYFRHYQKSVIITAATDGQIILFEVTELERRIIDFENSLNAESSVLIPDNAFVEDQNKVLESIIGDSVLKKLKIHQSGITSLAVKIEEKTSDYCQLFLASGGDDTAVNLVELYLTNDLSSKDLEVHKRFHVFKMNCAIVPVGHSAQITGIVLLSSDKVVTTSVDQRISVWSVSLSSQGKMDLNLMSSSYSNVADSSSMTVWRDEEYERYHLCIVGKGIGIYELVSVTNS